MVSLRQGALRVSVSREQISAHFHNQSVSLGREERFASSSEQLSFENSAVVVLQGGPECEGARYVYVIQPYRVPGEGVPGIRIEGFFKVQNLEDDFEIDAEPQYASLPYAALTQDRQTYRPDHRAVQEHGELAKKLRWSGTTLEILP